VQFTRIEDTELGFDCHVDVSRDGRTFTGVLAHEMYSNSEGIMRKPHVKNYLLDDLYLSPLALHQPESGQPGTLYLTKGERAQFEGYSVTFIDFETGGHGNGEGGMSAAAVLEVIGPEGGREEIRPMLRAETAGIVPVKAGFGDGQGAVEIVGIRPEEGGVMLRFEGDIAPPSAPASLVIELSRKPLIQVFWLGTLIVFLSGVISVIRVRWRGVDESPTEMREAQSGVSSSMVA
jgi:cytochrome c-type biogenesis protein CcmF